MSSTETELDVNSVAGELVTVRNLIKQLQEKEKGYANALKQYFAKPTKTVCGNVLVDLKQNKGRTTYDTKAAIADGVDLEPYKKIGAPTLVLTVTLLDE